MDDCGKKSVGKLSQFEQTFLPRVLKATHRPNFCFAVGSDYSKRRMRPVAGRSGTRNLESFTPAAYVRASAARYPLRTAPSIVAGQPVAVQSPARKTRGHTVAAGGRYASMPGRGE